MADNLTMTQLMALETIAGAAQRTAKVARAVPASDGSACDDVVYGTARHICRDTSGNFLRGEDDVRDGLLRVTSKSGFEYFWPVRELMAEVGQGMFAEYDWTY